MSATACYYSFKDGKEKRPLRFDDYHGEGASHLIESADVPRDRLLDLLHGVSLDPGDDVVDAVDYVNILDVRNLPELLQEVLFSPKVSVYEYERPSALPNSPPLRTVMQRCSNNPCWLNLRVL
jgi:hypothetical protein